MRRLLISSLMIAWAAMLFAQQPQITGTILDEQTGQPLAGATVKVQNTAGVSDEEGRYSLEGLAPGRLSLWFEANGYEPYSRIAEFKGEAVDLGVTRLRPMSVVASESGLSEILLSMIDSDDDIRSQAGSGLLSASADVFSSTAAYTFGPLFFRTRGYDNENLAVYMNGMMVNDPENGRASWSEWGGLNDATRNKEIVNGLGLANFTFGNLGGSTNIITRPSMHRRQSKFTYSLSNRTYAHRLMYTYSSGLRSDGWAFTFSGSRRWGNEGFIAGVFYDAWAYFASAEKKLNEQHSLAITVYGAPTRRGQQGPAVQEAYDLAGSNFYNPNWGYQNGEKRNARVKNFHEPMIMLNHYGKLSENLQWNNGVAFSFGYNGGTALNWYKSADPRPDYYRYLPSYATDEISKDLITQAWAQDENTSQIDWNRLYQVNYLSNLSGQGARYIIEDRRDDQQQLVLNSTVKYLVNDNLTVTGGIQFRNYKGSHFKTIEDLLGSNYWLDVDQFAERDFTGDTLKPQNDLDNPNRKVTEDDVFGYNYNIHQLLSQVWAQGEFNFENVEFYAGLSYTGQQFYRDGKMRNGRHPENSFGESEKYIFNDISLKTGGMYKLTGRHFIQVNGMYMTRAPFIRNAFLSARTRADVLPQMISEKIVSGEASYIMRYPFANMRFTAYHTIFDDQSEINSFYHDEFKTFVNHVMTGISKTHQGIEFGAEVKITSVLSVQAVASIGNYRYTNRPMATIAYDNGSKPDTTQRIYIKNFFVPGTPQTATSLGLKYAGPGFLFMNINANYFDRNYVDFNPERRTSAAIANLGPGDPLIQTITQQKKLPDAFTLDASIGKSWRFGDYFLNLNFSITNILDNQNVVTTGFEQLRFDFTNKDINKFPPKYFYAYGRTFFLNLGFRF